MRVIDFRARPNTAAFNSWIELTGPRTMFRKFGHPIPPVQSADEFVAELDRTGVDLVVCQGRDVETTVGWKVSNDHVAELARAHPTRIVGYAGIDPLKRDALAEVKRAIETLGLRGVMVEPYAANMAANDRRLYPIYGACLAYRVPVVITIGPLPVPGCYLKYGASMPVDEVATDLPELTIVCAHGGWPWVDEMVAIAFRHPNVYFDTSIYHYLPGQEQCVRAANEIVGDKLLYASGFPFAPLSEHIRYAALPFTAPVREQVMGGNAARILGLAR